MAINDPEPTLYSLVQRDLHDSKDWRDNQPEMEELRLKRRPPPAQPYPGAPTLIEPLIDDNIRGLTSAEISILWGASSLAVFKPLSPQALQNRAGRRTAVPQEAQTAFGGPLGLATCAPHSRQKRSPCRYPFPHEGHCRGAAEG